MDFHPIPYRGDPAGLEQHYLPKRGKAGTSVQSFFAQEQESRVLCYTNANLTRSDSAGEPLRFAEFWFEITGVYPEWLYFDSKATNYPGLSKLNQRGIWFITIRRRPQTIRGSRNSISAGFGLSPFEGAGRRSCVTCNRCLGANGRAP